MNAICKSFHAGSVNMFPPCLTDSAMELDVVLNKHFFINIRELTS